jgi:hypothetical protein
VPRCEGGPGNGHSQTNDDSDRSRRSAGRRDAGSRPAGCVDGQGQLVRVDTKANVLEIRTTAGAAMSFRYTDQTKVTGASEGVSGLATMSGADVTVQYTKQGQENIATSIAVSPPKK